MSLKWWLEDQQAGTRSFRFHPDLAWTRTQMGTIDNPKVRCVWGTSFDNIIIEGINASPLINAYRDLHDGPIAIGHNYFRRLPSMINHTLYDGMTKYYGVGIDYKSFDATIQPWLIHECFKILRENIKFTGYYEEMAFNYAEHFFIERPIVMPDGRMWLKKLGIPSGSYYTQLVGSIANYIATTFGQLKVLGFHRPIYVLGDDSLFGVPIELGEPNLDDYRQAIIPLGMTVHPDKGCIATQASQLEFLGHCAYGTRVSREDADLMRLALYPEYPVTGPAHSLARVKGLLLDSALTSWPIYHLHKLMTNKYGGELTEETTFTDTERSWLTSVLNITTPPHKLSTFRIFTLT